MKFMILGLLYFAIVLAIINGVAWWIIYYYNYVQVTSTVAILREMKKHPLMIAFLVFILTLIYIGTVY